MINLFGPVIKSEGITFFTNDAGEHAWYFLPDHPRISSTADGKAALQLIKYRRPPSSEGPLGGGLLSLDVELSATPEALERAMAILRAAHPGTDLTVQPIKADRVICDVRVGLADADGGAAVPQQAPVDLPYRVAVQMSLSMAGATLFETALNARALAGTATYQLRLAARRPIIPAALSIDWNRAAQFFAQQSDAAGAFSWARIEDGVRQLVTLGSIRIDIRSDAPDAAGMAIAERQAMHEAVMLAAAHLFDPGPASARASIESLTGADDPSLTERTIMDAQTYVRRDNSNAGVATFDLSQPRAGQLTLLVADRLANMVAAIAPANLPPVTAIEEEPWSFTVAIAAAFQLGEFIRLVQVAIRYGDRRVDLVLDPDHSTAQAAFMTNEQLGRRVTYEYQAYLTASPLIEASRTSFEAAPRTTDAAALVIDPRELLNVVPVHAVALFSFQQYQAAFVDVKIDVPAEGWSTTRTMILNDANREARFSVVVGHASTPVIQHRVRHVASGAVIEGAWQPTDPVAIVVGAPVGAATT